MAKETAVKDKDQVVKDVTKDLIAKADVPVAVEAMVAKKIKNASQAGAAKPAIKEVGKDHEGKTLVTSTDPAFTGLPWSYDTTAEPVKAVNLFNGDGKPYMQIYPDKVALTERDIAMLEPPYVVVNSMQIAPSRTGLKIHRGRIVDPAKDNAGIQQPRMEFSLYGLDDTAISEYYVVVDGITLTYYLDDKSSVVMELNKLGHGDDYDCYVSRRSSMPAEVVLINSSSENNLFLGENQLHNVDVKNSVMNVSVIRAQREYQGYRYGSRQSLKPWGTTDKEFKFKRHRHERLRLRRSQIADSQVPEGFYSKVTVTGSTLVSDRYLRVVEGYLDHAEIKGSTVFLERVNAVEASVHCEGHVTLRNLSLNGEHISQRALNMQNKFNFLKVDLPTDTLHMGRTSATEADIYIFTGTPKRILLTDDREAIEKVVTEVISGRAYRWEEIAPAPDNNPLAQSIIKYAVDAVMSRLEMIRILDSATEIVRTVEGRFDRWDDVLDN